MNHDTIEGICYIILTNNFTDLSDIINVLAYVLDDSGFSIRRKRANQSIWYEFSGP